MQTIDVHHHYVPEKLGVRLGYVRGEVFHYSVRGTRIMSIHDRMVDLEAQAADMDDGGIDTAVLSCFLGWDADSDDCRLVNDDIHRQASLYDGRFEGYAHLPTRDTTEALKELERCVSDLGFRAVTFMNQIDGRMLDDPSLDPLYARIEQLGLPVFVHPVLHCTDHVGTTDYGLDRVVGREFDLVTAILRVVAGGVLDRFPELKLIFSHFGGGVAGVYDRIVSKGYRFEERIRHTFPEYFQKLYFDTAGFEGGSHALRSAFLVMSPRQVMFGTDYPQDFTGVMTGRGASATSMREYVTEITKVAGPGSSAGDVLGMNFLRSVGGVGVRG